MSVPRCSEYLIAKLKMTPAEWRRQKAKDSVAETSLNLSNCHLFDHVPSFTADDTFP